MKSVLLTLLLTGLLFSAQPVFEQSSFEAPAGAQPAGWHMWTPRPENAPRLFVDPVHGRSGQGSLAISGNSNSAVIGGWERLVEDIRPGQWYRLTAWYRSDSLRYAPRQVVPRLDWKTGEGKRAGRPDYGHAVIREGEWTRITLEAPAPDNAASVALQFLLWGGAEATVWWDEISLTPIPVPAPRKVTIAAIHYRPAYTGTAAGAVDRFVKAVDKILKQDVDLILLGEGITIVGTHQKYADVAEPVPGPTTAKLGELARRHHAYVAAGVYEREGPALYTTAVLVDREGRFVGKYRKIYVPREETEGGISPGSDYPVFETDFGKVGMMICFDSTYPDPARGLALRGAEIILLPIWGGFQTLMQARALENHVFLATSGYDCPTEIFDPTGKIIATAPENGTAAIATVDLNKRYVEEWLGYMRDRYRKELRLDVPVESPYSVR